MERRVKRMQGDQHSLLRKVRWMAEEDEEEGRSCIKKTNRCTLVDADAYGWLWATRVQVKFVPFGVSLFFFVFLLVVRVTPEGTSPSLWAAAVAVVDLSPVDPNDALCVLMWGWDAGHDVQQRCLAMLVFITSLWVTEALPYFATALLVPPMVVFLGILNNKAHPEIMLTSSTCACVRRIRGRDDSRRTTLTLGHFSHALSRQRKPRKKSCRRS